MKYSKILIYYYIRFFRLCFYLKECMLMNNDNKSPKISRWYDRVSSSSDTMNRLKNTPDSLKRQVSTYLINEIISKKPYIDMIPLDVHYLVLSENRRRRWYDFDECVRIFVELLRHCSESQKAEVCNMIDLFIDKASELDE